MMFSFQLCDHPASEAADWPDIFDDDVDVVAHDGPVERQQLENETMHYGMSLLCIVHNLVSSEEL